jgi:chitinase
MLLFGGSGSTFSTVAADENLRNVLVGNLWTLIKENGYDGIDIDWEYPTGSGDRRSFFRLMSDLRATFPSPDYLISADVAPWGGSGYNLKNVVPLVDFLNIMTYDCAGPWTDDGQLNSPIFWDWHDPEPWMCQPGGSVEGATNIYLRSAPPEKLNIGTPFYGYFYRNVTGLWGKCDPCNDNTVPYEPYGTFIKQRINQKGWETFYDPVALVPYMLKKNGKPGFITYDDAVSTYLRVSYSLWERDLGGTFSWALDLDYDGQSQDLLDAMYQATINKPN